MPNANITHAVIRMYRMGTGDCFVVKFFAGDQELFKMMIDCGTWQGSKLHLTPFIEDLKQYVNNEVDLLVVTHEHKDHVHGFDACEELFKNGFTIRKIWMGWTENDKLKKVAKWKKDYGDKKKALAMAARRLKAAVESEPYKAQFAADRDGRAMLAARQNFARVLHDLAELQIPVNQVNTGDYVGLLEGMRVVKKELAGNNVQYFKPGDIIENLENAPGVKFYVLGPPVRWDDVKTEAGGEGESYPHNKELEESDAFAAAGSNYEEGSASMLPFDERYVLSDLKSSIPKRYRNSDNAWRTIDHEWLYSAGSLALRINSMTNNLSLALAIEFTGSGRVMLFPGDAEYGSWASWHKINWHQPESAGQKPLTEDLLNRTVFYKVAHHLSHNGTARRKGLELMRHRDLAAMATLDYDVISLGWKNTMPNSAIVADLLNQTKGRLMVMSEKGLFADPQKTVALSASIMEARGRMSVQEASDFQSSFVTHQLYLQYTVKA